MDLKTSKLLIALYITAAICTPCIFLFNLYNRNKAENYIIFSHVLIIAALLAVSALIGYFLLLLLTKSKESALTISILFWLCFWFFESIYRGFSHLLPDIRRRIVILIIIMILAGLTIGLRFLKSGLTVMRPAFNVLAVCLIMLLLFNLIPSVNYVFTIKRRTGEILDVSNSQSLIKREFYVDPNSPMPDIYWIHTDGMMSIETVERYWDTNLDWFRSELDSRGFIRYEDAVINAGFTYA